MAPDGSSKKVRKPYTITKSREVWTEEEHDKFLEALQLFDRDWKKIEDFIATKTVIQSCLGLLLLQHGLATWRRPSRLLLYTRQGVIHPHVHFQMLLQSNYSRSNNVFSASTTAIVFCSLLDKLSNYTSNQIRSHAQKYFLKVQKNGEAAYIPPPRPKRKAAHPYPQKASRTEDISCRTRSSDTSYAESSSRKVVNNVVPRCDVPGSTVHGIPDFAEVYTFIANVFDPHTSNHMQKLKEMNPINVETVLLLMRNLTLNLSSPEFEQLRCPSQR